MSKPFILYGTPGSLYTAKVRSFLRKQRIVFEEHPSGSAHFRENIAPLVGRWIMPVVETPTGTLIQDGADILDYFDQSMGLRLPLMPESSSLAVISHLFELFGGEGLLRPAMHYRWNFDAQNLDFVFRDFVDSLAPGASDADQKAIFAFASQRMRMAAAAFGVNPSTAPMIEHSYEQFLDLFEAHLKNYPYLLGARPTLGDYALIAPLFAHLSRDPAPSLLMKQRAPRVWRWSERMLAPEDFPGEGPGHPLVADHDLPDTLLALMTYIAQDYLPEMLAHIAYANDWLAARPDIAEGTNGLKRPGDRTIGQADFIWRGVNIQTAVMPYRFYLLQRLQDCFHLSAASDQQLIRKLFEQTGIDPLLDQTTVRRVLRQNHLEVWGPHPAS